VLSVAEFTTCYPTGNGIRQMEQSEYSIGILLHKSK
jgi:hypothetical protein